MANGEARVTAERCPGMCAQVRDALGLTYDVSFELSLFDRLRGGWFVCHVTSTPQKVPPLLLLLARPRPSPAWRAEPTKLHSVHVLMKWTSCMRRPWRYCKNLGA